MALARAGDPFATSSRGGFGLAGFIGLVLAGPAIVGLALVGLALVGLALVGSMLTATLLASNAFAQSDASPGRDLAIEHCAFCHVIGDYNKFGGIDSTPSFRGLANMRDGEERFRTFYVRRPHRSFVHLPGVTPPTDLPLNAPRVDLTTEELEAVIEFGLSFRE